METEGNFINKAQDLLQLVLDEKRVANIKTVGQAIHFAAAFDWRVTKHLSFFDWLWVRLKLLFRF